MCNKSIKEYRLNVDKNNVLLHYIFTRVCYENTTQAHRILELVTFWTMNSSIATLQTSKHKKMLSGGFTSVFVKVSMSSVANFEAGSSKSQISF